MKMHVYSMYVENIKNSREAGKNERFSILVLSKSHSFLTDISASNLL